MKFIGHFLLLVFVGGCTEPTEPKEEDPSEIRMVDGSPVGFYEDPAFPNGEGLMESARRVMPDAKFISLSHGLPGEDESHQYASFFVGRDISGRFESVYHRYFIFVRPKGATSWRDSRVFDWPDNILEPFSGPIALLEKRGTELKPKKSKQPPLK